MSPQKPLWHEDDHPSQSSEVEGVAQPMAFSSQARPMASAPDVNALEQGVRAGDRVLLSRAITLIESTLPEHRAQADELLSRVYPQSGNALRVGITGVPGAGKSTLLEVLGTQLCEKGRRLAVLTIDPSSELTGGSILGDKTRMENLSRQTNAFIRPSPSRGVLGGVARWTREAMILCEAAGYDTVFIETVGVGQSETLVRSMVDCFIFLTLSGAGDELQGIKRGILELSDIIAVTKADGDNLQRAEVARAVLERSTAYIQHATANWPVPVLSISALQKTGLEVLWNAVMRFEKTTHSTGAWDERRVSQRENWLKNLLLEGVNRALEAHPEMPSFLAASRTELPAKIAAEALKKILR